MKSLKNQFFYTRTVRTQGGSEDVILESKFRDSFSLSKVIRSVTVENGNVIVLLDDVHEQIQQMPIGGKNGKPHSFKEIRTMVQSEITLNAEDGRRFYALTNADGHKVNNSVEEIMVERPSPQLVEETTDGPSDSGVAPDEDEPRLSVPSNVEI